MSRKLENKNSTNFDVIREFVAGDNPDIVLSKVQQGQLNRWNFYINLKLQGELGSREIIAKMMAEFGVERATCWNDMGYAEALFGYSSSMNKRFRIASRIEFLEQKIKELYEDSDTVEYAVRLEGTLQKYYDSYPEMKQNNSPRIINYNFTKNEYNIEELPGIEDAILILEKAAKEAEE